MPAINVRTMKTQRFDFIKISEQVTGGTQRHFLTVAVFRPWRDSAGSAAPGLPGRAKHTRSEEGCQLWMLRNALLEVLPRSLSYGQSLICGWVFHPSQ